MGTGFVLGQTSFWGSIFHAHLFLAVTRGTSVSWYAWDSRVEVDYQYSEWSCSVIGSTTEVDSHQEETNSLEFLNRLASTSTCFKPSSVITCPTRCQPFFQEEFHRSHSIFGCTDKFRTDMPCNQGVAAWSSDAWIFAWAQYRWTFHLCDPGLA